VTRQSMTTQPNPACAAHCSTVSPSARPAPWPHALGNTGGCGMPGPVRVGREVRARPGFGKRLADDHLGEPGVIDAIGLTVLRRGGTRGPGSSGQLRRELAIAAKVRLPVTDLPEVISHLRQHRSRDSDMNESAAG
jgi:hypothetical protein